MVSHSGLQNVVPGVFGVTIFFFISGFLITSLLLNEREKGGTNNIALFYMRRVTRLYPPLLAYIVGVTIAILVAGQKIDFTGLIGALFYFANYLYALAPQHIEPFGVHLWSLSVEEHFYLLFPLLFVLGIGRSIPALFVLLVIALIIRLVLAIGHFQEETYLLVATECRFDSILIGCITALAVRGSYGDTFVKRATHPIIVALSLAAILLTFLYRDPIFRQTLRFTVQEFALVPLVLAAIFTARYLWVKKILNHWITKWIGVLSYSLYLWHIASFDLMHHFAPSFPAPVRYAIGWIIAFGFAIGVYWLIERPMFRIRRMFGSHTHERIA